VKVNIYDSPEELGYAAAGFAAAVLNQAIAERGCARVVLSTGASQFETLQALVDQKVDWSKIEMFHLDEYVQLPESHPASFRKYLRERFTNRVRLKNCFFVNGEGDIQANIRELTHQIRKEPIDLALVGIGENAHIAFNDPPADFNTQEAYIVVNLDENCKQQQVREGWFANVADVPNQAISMTVFQIMQSKIIVSAVPHHVKANAMKMTFENDVTPKIPATILKEHPAVHIFLDRESASLVKPKLLNRFQ
jgi:glucosamine-6-phosphate deaminase